MQRCNSAAIKHNNMKKTLGGDRLGSGNKMDIPMHGYSRSTHDLGRLWRSTMASGTLVPFFKEVALPGDTWDISLDVDVKTHPTIGPLFGSYKVQLDMFQIPMRLYNSLLHNNALEIGNNMNQVKFPQIEMTSQPLTLPNLDIDNAQMNPSCILKYLGIAGIGRSVSTETRHFNAMPLLMYWDIYKNYYANKQEKKGAVIHVTQPAIDKVITNMEITVSGGTPTVIPEWPGTQPTSVIVIGDTIMEVTYSGGTAPIWSTVLILYNGVTWVPITTFWQEIADSGTVTTFEWVGGNGRVAYSYAYTDAVNPGSTRPTVVTFDLENIDEMRNAILAFQSKTVPFEVDGASPTPYGWLCQTQEGIQNIMSTQEGLGIKTYQSDIYNNWLDAEWIDAINTQTAISTVGDMFTIDQLNLSKKVYDMLNRIALSGGTYDDWQDATYAHQRYKMCYTPMYEGGLIRELVFQEVVSNAETADQPLGTLAGKGRMAEKKKGGKIVVRVDEPAYIMGIVSLTPRIDYSQGNDWDINLQTMNDLHKPALDGIGFQDLIIEQMAWWTTEDTGTGWVQKSAGKQPAWLNYMTAVNKCYGNFAYKFNEMFMTLNRRYDANFGTWNILDLTTYIDPAKFNFIFAETSLDAQNFWVQIGINCTARRKMSAKIMPNL